MAPRTLFITTDLPSDTGSGGQIASWRALQAHSELASVDLLALAPTGSRPTRALLDRVERCQAVSIDSFHFAKSRSSLASTFVRSQVGPVPYRTRKFADARMRKLVDDLARERRYDVVHCDYVSNWQYAVRVRSAFRLLLHHNIEWQTYATLAHTRRAPLKWGLLREARRSAAYELRVINTAGHTLVLSEQDRAWIVSRVCPDVATRVSVWPVPAPLVAPHERPDSRRFLVLGSLRSLGRIQGLRWLLDEVWPHIRIVDPSAALDIVGADPPADIQAKDGKEGVAVHGFVEDLEPILAGTEACLIPLFAGGGVRIKIPELLARGIPCIGTPLAVQGMSDLPGVIAAEGIPAWTESITSALSDGPSLREAARDGRRELLRTHSLAAALSHLESALARTDGAVTRGFVPPPAAI